MTSQHYDLIIAGDAPGARMAAVLLGRGGNRILHLHGQGWPPYLLWNSSLLLEQLLDRLQARHCLTAAVPIQFHFAGLCIEFHGSLGWQDELRRELPDDASSLVRVLELLDQWGQSLQQRLVALGGSLSLAIGRRLRWQASRHGAGLRGRRPDAPLVNWAPYRELNPTAKVVCDGLLESLCLRSAASLSLTEAALAWSQLVHPRGVSAAALDKLLTQRLADSGMNLRPLTDLAAIEPGRSGRVRCLFGDLTASCDRLLLAGVPGDPVQGWPTGDDAPLAGHWHLATPPDHLPRLLAPRLLVKDAAGAFQLGLGKRGEQCEVHLRSGTPPDLAKLSTPELAALFGSGEPRLTTVRQTGGAGNRVAAGGERAPIRLGRGLFRATAEQVYPSLGLAGEALLGIGFVSDGEKSRHRA